MSKPSQAEVRSWARANGLTVNDRGSIATEVMRQYLDAHPANTAPSTAELAARNARPDLFAAADDLVEAELVRSGQLRFERPTTATREAPHLERSLTLSEWLSIRDDLATIIADHSLLGTSASFREAAEALLVQGWTRVAA